MKLMMKAFTSMFVFSTIYGGMTNSGTYSVKDGSTWGELINKESGVIDAIRGRFTKLTNYGTAKLVDCNMTEIVTSFGSLTATGTKFCQTLTVGGGEATLTSCQLENLIVVDPITEHGSRPPQIYLKGSTVVNGSIEFQGSSGVVYKGLDVVVSGEIINGNILNLQE